MARFSWEKLLKDWSKAMADSGQSIAGGLMTHKWAPWAGSEPATDAQISAAEQRLETSLPRSYKDFLRLSNGWRLIDPSVTVIWSIEKVSRLADSQPEIVEAYSRLPDVGAPSGGDGGCVDPTDFAHMIQISAFGDGCFLLNPRIRTGRGECQACFFASWAPGAEPYPSFKHLMIDRYEAFVAANPPPGSPRRGRSIRDMRTPPAQSDPDPATFLRQLEQLGYFKYCAPERAASMKQEFLATSDKVARRAKNRMHTMDLSPGRALFVPDSGRVVDLDISGVVSGRGAYCAERLRPLMSLAGIDVGPGEEVRSNDRYAMRLAGVEHEFFKIRNGKVRMPGAEHPINLARYVMYGAAKLACKALRAKGSSQRIATLEDMNDGVIDRLAFVLLDDELSYLVMWSAALDNYCRPMRADVF
jgi:hypothetical protein